MMARGDGRHRAEELDLTARQVAPRQPIGEVLRGHIGLTIYAVILMTAFNFFSHGTQDLYPNVFLGVQHGFDHATITTIALIYNAGAVIGGILFGALSQHIGRRITIVMAALLSLPVLPFWAFGSTALTLAIAAFLMQICVQGAWGVIPAHLNELSPPRYPGDVSWRGLPTRQSVGFVQCDAPGCYRRANGPRLQLGARRGCRSGGSGDRYSGRLRHGSTTRQDGRRRAPRARSIAERQ